MGISDLDSGGLKVLRRAIEVAYGVAVTGLVPVRSVFRVITLQGAFCLREMRRTARTKLAFLHDATEHMAGRGFHRVPRFHSTRGGEILWSFGPYRLTLTDWMPGKECWLEHPPNLSAAAAGLAALHQASQGMIIRPEHAPAVRLGRWAEEFAGGERLLAGCLAGIPSGARLSRPGRWLFEHGGPLLDRIRETQAGLAALEQAGEAADGPESGSFCHNSLYYQNILIDRAGLTYFVDLDRAVWDHRARDVAHLLDRYLHRVEWRVEAGRAALAAYERAWPLSPAGRKLVYLRLLYPERVLKRVRGCYIRHHGDPGHPFDRVKSVARDERRREKFLAFLRDWAGC